MIYNNNAISEHVQLEFASLLFMFYMILFREFVKASPYLKFTSGVQKIHNWSVIVQVT